MFFPSEFLDRRHLSKSYVWSHYRHLSNLHCLYVNLILDLTEAVHKTMVFKIPWTAASSNKFQKITSLMMPWARCTLMSIFSKKTNKSNATKMSTLHDQWSLEMAAADIIARYKRQALTIPFTYHHQSLTLPFIFTSQTFEHHHYAREKNWDSNAIDSTSPKPAKDITTNIKRHCTLVSQSQAYEVYPKQTTR